MPKLVPAIGPRDAKIVLLGEAPGHMEIVDGAPFVGPAGQQLDRMLGAAGLKRSDIYITNTIKHLVPQGDKKNNFFFRKKAPTPEYMEGIFEVLQEIQAIRPNVVVPLGNYALWALTQQEGIGDWRGSILESTMVPGQKVLPTYHPAFYIHEGHYNSNKEALGIWDFEKVRRESLFPEVRRPVADFLINPTPDEIEYAIERLLRADHITADTEWYGPENLAYIGFTDEKGWAICIPATSVTAYRAFKTILGSEVPKVFQNAAFDDLALSRQGIEVRGLIHDTMVAWHQCWGDIGEKRLATISSVLTEWPFYKDELDYVSKGDDRGQIYNATDCVVTDEAWVKLRDEEFEYTGGLRGYEIVQGIAPYMRDAARTGILCDLALMRSMAQEHLERADTLESMLSDTIGHKLNCRSSAQVIKLVFDELDYGKTRKVRTSREDILMDIASAETREAHKAILTAVIRVRQDRNIVSRYLNVDNAVDRDGRIRTNWNLAGTRGGARLSATIFGRGEQRWFPSVPMQTIPEDARVCYIADPDTVFIGWDLDQAEARVVAVKTRDYELLEDMERGIDIHLKLAAQMPFGKTYDELVEMCRAAEAKGKSKDTVAERYFTKKCRHSLNYVGGPGTLVSTVNKAYLDTGIGITKGQAKKLRDAYVRLHSGLEIWWGEVKALAFRNPRVIRTFDGRVHQFLGHFTDSMHREMVAFEPQALVADTVSLGIAKAMPLLQALDPNVRCFAHMHDGGLIQIRKDQATPALLIVKASMTRELVIDREKIIIPCSVKMGPNWRDLESVKI